MRPERDKRKRADGTDIDSIKNLAEFVQSYPPSGEVETPKPKAAPVQEAAPQESTATPPPTPEAVTQTPAPQYDAAELERLRAEAKAERERAAKIEAELQAERVRAQAQQAAREVLAQQNRPVPQQPQEDPRLKQIDELWFTDPPKARQLMYEVQRDERQKEIERERENIKKEVFTTLTKQQQEERARYAYSTAVLKLRDLGVPEDQITTNKVQALYSMITRPSTQTAPNPHYDRGSLLNADVIVDGWKELYGIPNGGATGANTAGTASVTPAQTVTATQPVPVAPPGSSRPAPAAVPRQQNDRAPALSADEKRDIAHLANQFGYDPEKLMERRRNRLAKERS